MKKDKLTAILTSAMIFAGSAFCGCPVSAVTGETMWSNPNFL